MALKVNITLKNLPYYVKVIITVIPAILIIFLALLIFILPKNKEIKDLNVKISAQENEIAKNQSKAAKLPELMLENENLKKRLSELKLQLPEEKEVSTLLKQVSDLCIQAGMKIALWRPQQKRNHPSGIVYEIPVNVELFGNYHSLGYFFSSLTKLARIVNISDIKLGSPKTDRGIAEIKVSFTATTFSSVPEEELVKQQETGKSE